MGKHVTRGAHERRADCARGFSARSDSSDRQGGAELQPEDVERRGPEFAAPRRVPMLLLSAFAGVAMLLAMLGIYGVTSYYVTQRTHEIGVRMALGAQIVDVMKLVLSRAMILATIGIAIGVVGAIALTRYLTSLLFGVKPIDVITFAGVALILALVVLVACLVPARRATKIDPLEALK